MDLTDGQGVHHQARWHVVLPAHAHHHRGTGPAYRSDTGPWARIDDAHPTTHPTSRPHQPNTPRTSHQSGPAQHRRHHITQPTGGLERTTVLVGTPQGPAPGNHYRPCSRLPRRPGTPVPKTRREVLNRRLGHRRAHRHRTTPSTTNDFHHPNGYSLNGVMSRRPRLVPWITNLPQRSSNPRMPSI